MTTDQDSQLEDITRLLAVMARQSFETQSEAIAAMSKAGMKPSRIADLLGTTPGTVNDAISRAKKR